MFNVLGDINYLALLAAFVTSVVLAGLYFAVLTPRYYAIALGRQGAPAPEQTVVSGVGPLVCILITTLTSAVLIESLNITSAGTAVAFGLIVGIGYLTAMTFQIAINPNFPRPLYYGTVNAPYFIVTSLVSSLILVALR